SLIINNLIILKTTIGNTILIFGNVKKNIKFKRIIKLPQMRHLKNIGYKRPQLLVLCFFLCMPLWAKNNNDNCTKADCDSIIHKGIKNSERGNYIKALEYFTV